MRPAYLPCVSSTAMYWRSMPSLSGTWTSSLHVLPPSVERRTARYDEPLGGSDLSVVSFGVGSATLVARNISPCAPNPHTTSPVPRRLTDGNSVPKCQLFPPSSDTYTSP